MNFIVARINPAAAYALRPYGVRSSDCVKEYIFVELPDKQLIETWYRGEVDGGGGERMQQLLDPDKRVYKLLLHSNRNPDQTDYQNYLFCAEELTILQKPVPVQDMQLRNAPAGHALLQDVNLVGEIFPALLCSGYYADKYYFVLPDGRSGYCSTRHLCLPSADFKKPETVIARVNAYDLGISSGDKVYLELLFFGSVYQVKYGNRAGSELRPSQVTLPTDEERPIWQRKLSLPKQLSISERLKPIIQDNVGLGNAVSTIWYAAESLTRQRSTINSYVLAANGPDYLDVAEDYTKVSYLDSNKVAGVLEKGQDPWTSSSRVTVSWAKLLGKLYLKDLYSASTLEQCHNSLTAACTTNFGPEELRPELLIVRGREVGKYYHKRHYVNIQKGQLWSSCMREAPSDWFGLYMENPDKVGLLISRDRESGKIWGRALVWTKDAQQYLDRVYAISDVEHRRMQAWAKQQGMIDIWDKGRNTWDGNLSIQLDMPYQEHYPYMDSMAFLDVATGLLHNKYQNAGSVVEMRSTSGTRSKAHGEARCVVSNRLAPKAKMVETVSKQHALGAYVKQLRTGGHEVESLVVADELAGGHIAKGQAAAVVIGSKQLITLQSNPDICWVSSTQSFVESSKCAYSKLDKGFILKEGAELMPDGSYCSPVHAAQYKLLLQRRQPNKARVATRQEAVLA